MERILHYILLSGAALCILTTLLFFKECPIQDTLLVQNTNDYLGPHAPIPGNPQLIRIQIIVHDSPNPQGVKIDTVTFNNTPLTLKPSDIYGFRGQSSFQLQPGKYTLRWRVHVDRHIWPRTITHEEEVELSPRDFWLQINITGDTASIT